MPPFFVLELWAYYCVSSLGPYKIYCPSLLPCTASQISANTVLELWAHYCVTGVQGTMEMQKKSREIFLFTMEAQ